AHGAALLTESGLVEAADVLAVEQRRGAEDLVDGHDAGAADAHHEHVGGTRHLQGGLGQRAVDDERLAFPGSPLALGNDRQERRAIAAQARVVLVAGRLVNLRLASDLRIHRLHRQTVGLGATVATTLADRLIDIDAQGGVLELAPLAQAPLFGGAALIVDQHGDAGNGPQQALRLVEAVAGPDLGAAAPERSGVVLVGLVGGYDDPLDALGLAQPAHLRHPPGAPGI